MRAEKDAHIDEATKHAWDANWRDTSVERIMEIFSYPRVRENMDIFLSCLPKGKRVLEGGCGLGPYLIRLKSLGYDMVGVDYNVPPLQRIAGYDRSILLACADVQGLPFVDSSFGAYMSLGVIEHFTEGPEKAIREAYRVLEPGGHFIVKVPRTTIFERLSFPLTFITKHKTIRKMFGKPPADDHYWEQRFNTTELASVLEKNGFKVEKILPVDQEHGLIAFSSVFRDKKSYDGPNGLCLAATKWCKRFIPWLSAPGVVFVCRKVLN